MLRSGVSSSQRRELLQRAQTSVPESQAHRELPMFLLQVARANTGSNPTRHRVPETDVKTAWAQLATADSRTGGKGRGPHFQEGELGPELGLKAHAPWTLSGVGRLYSP